MSMHLVGPWLSTTGKKKGKQKFRNAEQAQKARAAEQSWNEFKDRWGIPDSKNAKKALKESREPWKPKPLEYRGANDPKIPSLPFTGGPCVKKETHMYTGTLIKGIATMHKSNAVPVLNDEEAVAIAKMRR